MENLSALLVQNPEDSFRLRADGIKKWLREIDGCTCQEEQLHTTEGTSERIYWHYGYMVALCDVLRLLEDKKAAQN
jgi:hypothetical protein